MKTKFFPFSLVLIFLCFSSNLVFAQFQNPDAADTPDSVNVVEEAKQEDATEPKKRKKEKDYDGNEPTLYEKIYKGGTLVPYFRNRVTSIGVTPMVGYQPNDYVAFGTSFTYQLTSNRNYIPTINSTVYGTSFWARAFPIEPITIHLEVEKQAWKVTSGSNGVANGVYNPAFLLGGGYRTEIGRGAYWHLLLLYNLNWSSSLYNGNKTQYSEPIIFRTSINF